MRTLTASYDDPTLGVQYWMASSNAAVAAAEVWLTTGVPCEVVEVVFVRTGALPQTGISTLADTRYTVARLGGDPLKLSGCYGLRPLDCPLRPSRQYQVNADVFFEHNPELFPETQP